MNRDRPTEFWIVESETHLAPGCLAYWGPFATHDEAFTHDFHKNLAVVVEIPCERIAAVAP